MKKANIVAINGAIDSVSQCEFNNYAAIYSAVRIGGDVLANVTVTSELGLDFHPGTTGTFWLLQGGKQHMLLALNTGSGLNFGGAAPLEILKAARRKYIIYSLVSVPLIWAGIGIITLPLCLWSVRSFTRTIRQVRSFYDTLKNKQTEPGTAAA